MIKISSKKYFRRELTGIIVFPFVSYVLILLASFFKWIPVEDFKTYMTYATIAAVASILGFLITFKVTFRRTRK